MNRPAVVVGLMVLVGLCLLGLGFEFGRSHGSATTTTTTTITTQAPQSEVGAKWWSGVESQVDYISSAETSAYTEWFGLCFPDGSGSYCSQALPSLTRLNNACSSFNPSTTGATKQEIYAMNQLEGACDVYWLEPTNLDTQVFTSVSLLASNLASIGGSS